VVRVGAGITFCPLLWAMKNRMTAITIAATKTVIRKTLTLKPPSDSSGLETLEGCSCGIAMENKMPARWWGVSGEVAVRVSAGRVGCWWRGVPDVSSRGAEDEEGCDETDDERKDNQEEDGAERVAGPSRR
jgi:hypothetical protein